MLIPGLHPRSRNEVWEFAFNKYLEILMCAKIRGL